MHWKNLANYDYLGAYSLDGVAAEVVLTIKSIKKERVTSNGGASEDCIVAYFEETKVDGVEVKPMVLNKTNCKTIEKIYNTGDVEHWIGKKITVFATTTKFARDVVPCLRIRQEVPVEKVYTCTECGVQITKAIHDGSLAKYGIAVCSKECLEKSREKTEETSTDKGE